MTLFHFVLCILFYFRNDKLAEKNGTKKTVYWVKKKPREETGNVKGEKWVTSQQYIGDWKMNKKDGYGIKIYSNKDKYEGYWKNDMRHGKGTYWLCIGKNKYRKFYTGDWFENKKEGKGIYFYKDGGCYDGNWKNSKRHGKGLMIYANGDIYEGNWINDLKHGYGIIEYAFPESKNGHKYYGYWSNDLKEGQGYYYYSDTGKIYLGEWHENVPKAGIFSDVNDEKVKRYVEETYKSPDKTPQIPVLKLKNPGAILEESISHVHFVRQIKLTKSKNFSELFALDYQQELISLFKSKQVGMFKDEENVKNSEKVKLPDSTINLNDFINIFKAKHSIVIEEEILELVLRIFKIVTEDRKFNSEIHIDFLLFSRLFYLMYIKYIESPPEIDFSVHSKEITEGQELTDLNNENSKDINFKNEQSNEYNQRYENNYEENEDEEYEEENENYEEEIQDDDNY